MTCSREHHIINTASYIGGNLHFSMPKLEIREHHGSRPARDHNKNRVSSRVIQSYVNPVIRHTNFSYACITQGEHRPKHSHQELVTSCNGAGSRTRRTDSTCLLPSLSSTRSTPTDQNPTPQARLVPRVSSSL
ncbi:hypothetical protein C8Q70DRAFT_428287 [Cubamyces menziesii]|nr:hypothetical protein C8Q70DRAFT_428287 [Cubamyces menziesii]